jgi:RNA polymerase sigma-70 factor (ECF subfamily)
VSDVRPSADLVARIRTGDGAAAAELVRQFEPVIRTRVRVWLRMQDARLRRLFDSMDICQSVLASFFVRAAAGQYDLDRPEQLIGLLVQMARHKLGHQVSRQTALRRDVRRVSENGLETNHPAQSVPSPADRCANQELLNEVRRRLTDEELRIADHRAAGNDWAAIASEMGGTAAGRRMQFARALDRVSEQLGLDEPAFK